MSRHSSLAAFASLFLLASAASPNNNAPECLHNRSQELAALASCGDEGSINYCFTHLVSSDSSTPVEQLASELESCFVSAGCTNAESQIEALWTLQRCNDDPSELRRRRNGAIPLPREAAPMPGITMVAARQADNNPTTTAAIPTSTLTCFTETSVEITSCPVQTTGGDSGKKLSCFPTVVPSSVCADGLICQVDGQGNPSCMVKQSKLPLEGIIIAIVFASFIAVSVISICFFCCRERRQQNRLIRAAEAAKIAQEAKTQAMIDAKKSASRSVSGGGADRTPLMSQPAGEDLPALQQQYGGGYQQAPNTDYDNGHGQNPFTDSHPMR
ncbi:hypothetical protein B0T14DRAFT_423150 [Immersiella caudata]|uniref:Uncharacterized protein n=1 Tax=Immersiella caudata TaxID=314043 RepID=A0AA39X4R0_9PEZI|nr:hypothetical protein B0T14DRAFT_423150 [Immersiella caudata]